MVLFLNVRLACPLRVGTCGLKLLRVREKCVCFTSLFKRPPRLFRLHLGRTKPFLAFTFAGLIHFARMSAKATSHGITAWISEKPDRVTVVNTVKVSMNEIIFCISLFFDDLLKDLSTLTKRTIWEKRWWGKTSRNTFHEQWNTKALGFDEGKCAATAYQRDTHDEPRKIIINTVCLYSI